MLVHGCLDVVAMSCVLQFTVISGAAVAPSLAPWGTIELSRGTLEHKKRDVGIQAWISIDLRWISGPRFDSTWQTLE